MGYGTLYVVATPIGNLADFSSRGRQLLEEATLIAAEDTRHTGRLLSNFGIKTPQKALHEHNEAQLVPELIERMKSGATIALVSDAGTPLISDPGYRLVVAAHEAGVTVSPIVGPSAITAALSVAGLPTDRFCFEGFLAPKREARRRRLAALRDETRSLVFFVSVHRVESAVDDLAEAFGQDRLMFMGRELTKLHEQCVRGTIGEIQKQIGQADIAARGEFVVVVAGAADPGTTGDREIARWLQELAGVVPDRQAVDIVSRATERRRNDVYRVLLDLKREAGQE